MARRTDAKRAAAWMALAAAGSMAPACYSGLPDEPFEVLEDRGGAVPGRWLMPADVAEVSEDLWFEIDGSPPGAHKASNCTGTFLPGAQILKDYLLEHFDGAISIGGYNCRPINHDPSKPTSVHGLGRALDIHVTCAACAADNEAGDPIAHWLIEHAEEIGIQRIIWDGSSWKPRELSQTLSYGGGHPHNDHLHVELNLDGAYAATPWFGGDGPSLPPEPEEPPLPPPQDDCPAPCWPAQDLGTHCEGGIGGSLSLCADVDGDGCTEWTVADACGGAGNCYGDAGVAMCCTGSFCDDDGSIFEGDIDYIAGRGITQGCSEGMAGEPNYCPSEEATRAMVIVMLGRASGMPPMDEPDAFTDDDGHWAERHINAAAYYGITQGIGNGEFGPQLTASRTHVAAFFVNVYGLPASGVDHFDDDDDMPAWKQDVHNRLYDAGITHGCGERRFCGDETITREQLAAFIARADQSLEAPSW